MVASRLSSPSEKSYTYIWPRDSEILTLPGGLRVTYGCLGMNELVSLCLRVSKPIVPKAKLVTRGAGNKGGKSRSR